MPPLTVTLTINNPEDPARATVTGAVGGTALNAALESKDLYKVIYSEAMSDYRYFGTLRGAIAWAPALVTAALIGALLAEDFPLSEPYLWGTVIAVFVLIYIANHYLQMEQRKRRLVARKAERLMVNPDGVLRTYPELVTVEIQGVKKSRISWWPDGPSWFLLLFLIVLGLFVYWTAHNEVDRAGPDVTGPLPQQQQPPPPPANHQE